MAIKQREQRGKDKNRRQPDAGAHLNNLPNTFKFAAETLKMMSERGGSAGSIVVSKYKSYNYKLIYALVMNTLKNIRIIKKIIHETKLQKKVLTVHDPFMLEILVGDLLFGRGLKSVEQNQSAAAILNLKESITKQKDLLKKDFSKGEETGTSAKYLRINHLKSNIDHILSQLSTVGLKQVEYSKDKIKFKKFINKFKSLENNEFMLDFHFPNDLIVLTTEGADKIKKLDLLSKGKAMLQDKASFMAVEALDIKPGDKVIDACCAPGCKTSLIATKIKNKGKILAYDVDKKRLLTAQHLLKVQGATCVKTELLDFSKVKLKRLPKALGIEKFDSILIDPSCSGSGIQSRVDYRATKVEAGRLKKLQAFQVALLKHALKADVSKSIVYCTCSTSTEENEQALEMALNESGMKSMWDAVEILPYWPHRGEQNYELGQKYIRSDPSSLTNGFFIAKLVRNENQNDGKIKDEMPETSPDNGDIVKKELDDNQEDAEDEQMVSGSDEEDEEEDEEGEEEDDGDEGDEDEEDEDEELSDEDDD